MLSLKIITEGHRLNIAVIIERKRSQCLEFIESLASKTRNRMKAIMKQLADRGEIRNDEMFKSLGSKIWEFKAKNARIYCFYDRNTVVCTHGAYKVKRKRTKVEIKKAQDKRKIYFEQQKRR